jgi:hypothetical protein
MKNEELVQRFVDQELSAGERMQFVIALGRDQALREHVLTLEQLVLDAAKLPRPGCSRRFAARVLERTRLPWSPPFPSARRRTPLAPPDRRDVGAARAAMEPRRRRRGCVRCAACSWRCDS